MSGWSLRPSQIQATPPFSLAKSSLSSWCHQGPLLAPRLARTPGGRTVAGLRLSLSMREICLSPSVPLQSPVLSPSPTWMSISFPSCLLSNRERLKGDPLLLPGGWMFLKRVLLRIPFVNPRSILWYCPLLVPFLKLPCPLYSSTTAPSSVWSGYRWPGEGW